MEPRVECNAQVHAVEVPAVQAVPAAHMERECSDICSGKAHFQEMVDSCIGEISAVFQDVPPPAAPYA